MGSFRGVPRELYEIKGLGGGVVERKEEVGVEGTRSFPPEKKIKRVQFTGWLVTRLSERRNDVSVMLTKMRHSAPEVRPKNYPFLTLYFLKSCRICYPTHFQMTEQLLR